MTLICHLQGRLLLIEKMLGINAKCQSFRLRRPTVSGQAMAGQANVK